MLTYEEQEALRQDRINEKGTEPPCPFCNRPRVKRSDYIRCNQCGVNWLDGEEIMTDPRAQRKAAMMGTRSTKQANDNTAPPAQPISDR